MIGASGAIAGVLGAYFVLFPHSRIVTLLPLFIFWQIIEVPAIFFLGFWFLMQFLSGVGSRGRADDRRCRVLGARRRLRRRGGPGEVFAPARSGAPWSGGIPIPIRGAERAARGRRPLHRPGRVTTWGAGAGRATRATARRARFEFRLVLVGRHVALLALHRVELALEAVTTRDQLRHGRVGRRRQLRAGIEVQAAGHRTVRARSPASFACAVAVVVEHGRVRWPVARAARSAASPARSRTRTPPRPTCGRSCRDRPPHPRRADEVLGNTVSYFCAAVAVAVMTTRPSPASASRTGSWRRSC